MWLFHQDVPEDRMRCAEEAMELLDAAYDCFEFYTLSEFHEARAIVRKLTALLEQVE